MDEQGGSAPGSGAGAVSGWERWVHAPRQARARVTFERVLDAGALLLAEAGYEGFSIAEVCRRAGVAAGTLYGRVENKDLLFLALHDRELRRITDDAVVVLAPGPAWASLDPPAFVRGVVRAIADHYDREAALLRVFILRAAVDVRVRDEGVRHVAALEDAVTALLLTRRGDLRVTDAGDAVRTVTRLVLDSLSWATAFGADFHTAGPTGGEDWVGRLGDVAAAYLLACPDRDLPPVSP